MFCHPLLVFLLIFITAICILLDKFSFVQIIVSVNVVSFPFASFVGAGHFFLQCFLVGFVEFLTMLLAVFVNLFGQMVECLEAILRPTIQQLLAVNATSLANMAGSFCEPRRLAATIMLAICWCDQ